MGAALAQWSVSAVYTGFGVLMAVSVLGFCRVPRFREFLDLGHEHIADWHSRQYLRAFD